MRPAAWLSVLLLPLSSVPPSLPTGRLAAPGLAAAPSSNRYAPKPAIPELPAYVAKAFKTNREAWQHFQALPRRSRRDFVVWIHTAKRPETRERRIRESMALLAAGKRLGLK